MRLRQGLRGRRPRNPGQSKRLRVSDRTGWPDRFVDIWRPCLQGLTRWRASGYAGLALARPTPIRCTTPSGFFSLIVNPLLQLALYCTTPSGVLFAECESLHSTYLLLHDPVRDLFDDDKYVIAIYGCAWMDAAMRLRRSRATIAVG